MSTTNLLNLRALFYAKTNLIYAKTHKMNIGIKIKRLRESHRISQSELANMLDIEQSHLSRIESEKTKKFTVQLIYKICRLFEVDFLYFVDEHHQSTFPQNLSRKGQFLQNFDSTNSSKEEQDLLLEIKTAQNTLKKLIKSFKNKR